jgi:hypothetical protein
MGRNAAICCKDCCKRVNQKEKKDRRNSLSQRALQCWGDWIRTSDLLNPIQEAWRVNRSENTSLSRLAAF